jgi:hypothetical protein
MSSTLSLVIGVFIGIVLALALLTLFPVC